MRMRAASASTPPAVLLLMGRYQAVADCMDASGGRAFLFKTQLSFLPGDT